MSKLTATHEGQTFTRNTDRAYQFVVVSKPSYLRALATAKADALRNSGANTIRYYTESAKPGSPYTTDAQRAEYARLAALGSNGLYEELLARQVAHIDALQAKGHYDKFVADNWCGRRDLAEKAAAESRRYGRLEVAIVPVNA